MMELLAQSDVNSESLRWWGTLPIGYIIACAAGAFVGSAIPFIATFDTAAKPETAPSTMGTLLRFGITLVVAFIVAYYGTPPISKNLLKLEQASEWVAVAIGSLGPFIAVAVIRKGRSMIDSWSGQPGV